MAILDNKKLLIFDCDGVLFDSHEANLAYFDRCMKEAHYPPVGEELREKVVYMSVRQLINEIISDQTEAERVFRVCQEIDYSIFIPKLVPLFDFDTVFSRLKRHYHLAVATNRGKSLEALFAHFNLDQYFSFRVSTLDATPKPEPDMLLKCLVHFNIQKSEAVFIGDSISDRDAAANAGIDYIWVRNRQEEPNISSVRDLIQQAQI
jgi:phosphoglycolate phosphatase